ncbi:MAG: chloride channel protein, partial [Thermoguttaceae bacterium]|nr:chloride channel protein [Thermoguttaceae bacterium]
MAGLIGLVSGGLGALFRKSVTLATEYGLIYHGFWLLPVGGVLIVVLYQILGMSSQTGTNQVITAVREGIYRSHQLETEGKDAAGVSHQNRVDRSASGGTAVNSGSSDSGLLSEMASEPLSLRLAPAVFLGTVLTQFLGGSAGREGAALQIGGCIGLGIGRLFRFGGQEMSLMILCGMSGVFAALFGTPLTAALFVLEVVSVGIFYYSRFVPCLISSLVAWKISLLFGGRAIGITLSAFPVLSFSMIFRLIILAAFCALVSVIFCVSLEWAQKWSVRWIKNPCFRIMVGGTLLLGLTFFCGTTDYNGSGIPVIVQALHGQARADAFFWKMLFTVVTIGLGFKGGEIIPAFFIGATFGAMAGPFLDIEPGLAAALAMTAVFCAAVNCPITSIILSVELFGTDGLLFFAIVCGVSYILSGYYS